MQVGGENALVETTADATSRNASFVLIAISLVPPATKDQSTSYRPRHVVVVAKRRYTYRAHCLIFVCPSSAFAQVMLEGAPCIEA